MKTNSPEWQEWRKAHRRKRRAQLVDVAGMAFPYAKLEIAREKYGITKEQYAIFLIEQHRACATCSRPFEAAKEICVDHCHATGRVRGLLCHYCNVALGNAKDSPAILRALARYVEAANEV